MPPGYIKLWRKTLESDIWDMPPLYFKIWSWLLLQVDWNTGTMTVTLDHIADRNQWVENNQPKVPHRKAISRILHWMEEQGMVNLELCGAGNRKYSKISVCNWDSYQSEKAELVTEMDPEKKQKRTTLKEVVRSTKKKDKIYVPTPEAEKAYQIWNDLAPLNVEHQEAHLETFDKMHRLDSVEWNSSTGIYEISRYAAGEWAPKYIQTPSALRTPSRKYPELKTWQVIQNQLRGQRQHPAKHPAKPPQDHIVESTGEPITDPDTRLRRIQLYAPRATTDPDQDRWYTLPDHVIQSGDLDPDTRQDILARNPDHVEA